MSFIGNQRFQRRYSEYFSGNGSLTAFTMKYAGMNIDGVTTVDIRITGATQSTTAYGITGKTLTFLSAPPSGANNIEVVHLLPVRSTPADILTITNLPTLNVGLLNVESTLIVGGNASFSNIVTMNVITANITALAFNTMIPTTHYASFESAVAAAAPKGNTIIVCSNTVCSTNTTVPANVQLTFVGNGLITINTGVVVTIDSVIEEGASQLFAGLGNVSFGTSKSKRSIPQWFGVVADGIVNDTDNFFRSLRALTTGGLFDLPHGRYLIWRGTGAVLADTILASNTTIQGAGVGTLLQGRKSDGTIPDDGSNQFYNIFQATNKNNIQIRDLAIEGYDALLHANTCNNLIVQNITSDGLLDNASNYLIDKQVHFYRCKNTQVLNSRFFNGRFSVYLEGSVDGRCETTRVDGCHFEHLVAANTYIALFPVGVYDYWANNTSVTHNTFKNIFSSVDDGDEGTGMGFGFYEGDGKSSGTLVNDNTFIYEAKGLKRAMPILFSTDDQIVISDNRITVGPNTYIRFAMRISPPYVNGASPANGAGYVLVSGNQIIADPTANCYNGIYFLGSPTSTMRRTDVTISDNEVVGPWLNGISVFSYDQPDYYGPGANGTGSTTITIQDNFIREPRGFGIYAIGSGSEGISVRPLIRGNRMIGTGEGGIHLAYTISPIIENNTILDGNLTQDLSEEGSCIYLSSYVHGARIVGNNMGNTLKHGPKSPQQEGKYNIGIVNVNSANVRIYKDIIFNNQFQGIPVASNIMSRFNVSTPQSMILDVSPGEIIYNSRRDLDPATEGWLCNSASFVVLTANATNSNNGVKVSSTSGWLAGDRILLVKANTTWGRLNVSLTTANSIIYMNAAHYHSSTIQAVANGTDIFITDAIPSGDGTYENGVAYIKRARFVAV